MKRSPKIILTPLENELRFEGIPYGPNDRINWQGLAQNRKKWRESAREAAKKQRIGKNDRIKVHCAVYRERLGLADEDNDRARFKPVIDGLVDAGIIPNDKRNYIVWGRMDEKRVDQNFGKVGIGITIIPLPKACSWCLDDRNDVKELDEQYAFCLDCYAGMVGDYLTIRHGGMSILAFIKELELKREGFRSKLDTKEELLEKQLAWGFLK